ncbi:MAG: hypothetical protein KDA25_05625 [Phycisphaerales bacterium]|nr:hypothetical protein [Phycisphaerales bacterium]
MPTPRLAAAWSVAVALPLAAMAIAPAPPVPPTTRPDTPPPAASRNHLRELPRALDTFAAEAAAAGPLVTTDVARAFLDATARLPEPEPRRLFYDSNTLEHYTFDDLVQMDPKVRRFLLERPLPVDAYYLTWSGSPIAYVRAIDLLGRHGLDGLAGRRIIDFGYGGIGHLRLLALNGAHVTGVDVDTRLRALYSTPQDQGPIGPAPAEGEPDARGTVTLVHGHWPGEDDVRAAVGEGYDVFIAKNTLKRGYIHPSREAPPRQLITLGVDDETYVKAMFDILKPGGLAILYNLHPAPAPEDEPYRPWADGASPFPQTIFEAAGFEVVAFDVDDTEAARAMARAMKWNDPPQSMDIDGNLFATYVIVRRPR